MRRRGREKHAGNGNDRTEHADERRGAGGALCAAFGARSQEGNRPCRCGRARLYRRLAVSGAGDGGRTLLIPDRRGNNRIDSLKNLVEDPRIALIFFVPGANETYRVNGRARVSADPLLRRRFAVNGKEPTAVIVVRVEQAFHHCPKALVRSDLWKAGSNGRPKGVPTLG